jgi:hypothetical protein
MFYLRYVLINHINIKIMMKIFVSVVCDIIISSISGLRLIIKFREHKYIII